jgi:uncharacterized protein YdaU (DUF1376 family)
MHYYQFNIADFNLHTSHLTLEEEAIYRRLIDFYYDTEQPIPKETQPVMRRLRLVNHGDLVASILGEFFVLECDGWHNYRCDFELKAYKAKADSARANGKKGGRPRKNKGLETHPVILANPDLTQTKANYELLTTNQELVIKDIDQSAINPVFKKPVEQDHDHKDLTNQAFKHFWDKYPKRVDKQKASLKMSGLLKGKNKEQAIDLINLITTNIDQRLQNGNWCEGEKQFIPSPAKYLHNQSWTDELI